MKNPIRCPGEDPMSRVAPEQRICPNCGAVVEIFTDEQRALCRSCGEMVEKSEAPSRDEASKTAHS